MNKLSRSLKGKFSVSTYSKSEGDAVSLTLTFIFRSNDNMSLLALEPFLYDQVVENLGLN